MIAGALNADPAKFESKSAKSVRSRVGNIKDFLPESIGIQEFWNRMLDELSRDGMTREELTEKELREVAWLADEKYGSWEWNWGKSPRYGYSNKKRFPGGTMEAHVDIEAGKVNDLIFFGDYMATTDDGLLLEALRGQAFRRDVFAEILDRFDLSAIFGGIGKVEILSLLFD